SAVAGGNGTIRRAPSVVNSLPIQGCRLLPLLSSFVQVLKLTPMGAIPCGRPCAPTSGLSEGCPHHPRTGANPALRLHELGGLIRRRVGLTLAVNLGVGRGPRLLKLVPIGDPLRSPLRRGLHPPGLLHHAPGSPARMV